MQFLTSTNIDFVGKRKVTLYAVLIVAAALVVSFTIHGGLKYGIDFRGGTLMQFKFEKDVAIGKVRDAISNIGYGNSEIKHFGANNEVLIWMEVQPNPESVSDTLKTALQKEFPGNTCTLERVESVGPKIGKELIWGAIKAVIVSSALLIIYLTFRFEFRFALTTLVCGLFDVLFITTVFSVFSIEFSLATVAAILTILGYSLNDTIVIMDRIRENLKSLRKESFATMVNRSINITLSRTIITSLTVFIVVIVLYVFGGAVIHDFYFALLIGVFEGSLSTLYIAAPFLVAWTEWSERRKLSKLRTT